jgi:hypothetical protein
VGVQGEGLVKVYTDRTKEDDLNTEAADGWEVAFMAVESAQIPHGPARVHIILKRRKP